MISLIAAIGKNNELGKGNTLLWHLPADMKFFREKTLGHPVIMGRKTFESLGRPLPNRHNIVITRDKTYLRHGVNVVNSLEEAINSARTSLTEGEPASPHDSSGAGEEVFIIGGAEIYKQAIPIADRLYITHIEAEDENADTFLPTIDKQEWKLISEESHQKDEKNPFDYTFSIYEKN